MQVRAGDENAFFCAGDHQALELRIRRNKIQVLVQFHERGLVENIRGRIGPIEGEHADVVFSDRPLDERFRTVGFGIADEPRRGGPFRFRFRSRVHSRSSQIAAPWPPPTQRETNARLACRRASSLRLVKMRRAPVAPTGWPSAMAPPFTFSRSFGIFPSGRSRPKYFRAKSSDFSVFNTASTCAAKASLISTMSACSQVSPV